MLTCLGLTYNTYRPLLFKLDLFLRFLPQAVKIGSPAFRRKVVEILPSKSIQQLVSIIDTIETQSRGILQRKRKALEGGEKTAQAQIGNGKDIMSVLRASIPTIITWIFGLTYLCSESKPSCEWRLQFARIRSFSSYEVRRISLIMGILGT